MSKFKFKKYFITFCLISFFAFPVQLKAETDEMIDSSYYALRRIVTSEDMQFVLKFIRNAKAILIIPDTVKVGFIGGFEYGEGLLLVRRNHTPGNSGWSQPIFYKIGTGSVGLQIGAQSTDILICIMNDEGLTAVLNDSVKLGADLSLSAWKIGSGVEQSTDGYFESDFVAFARPTGFFGGISLKGSYITLSQSLNREFYGITDPVEIMNMPAQDDPRLYRMIDFLSRY